MAIKNKCVDFIPTKKTESERCRYKIYIIMDFTLITYTIPYITAVLFYAYTYTLEEYVQCLHITRNRICNGLPDGIIVKIQGSVCVPISLIPQHNSVP